MNTLAVLKGRSFDKNACFSIECAAFHPQNIDLILRNRLSHSLVPKLVIKHHKSTHQFMRTLVNFFKHILYTPHTLSLFVAPIFDMQAEIRLLFTFYCTFS